MKRREFIVALGGAATGWPFIARAQQPAMPVIGYLDPDLDVRRHWLAAFRKGLKAQGFVEGQNVAFEYRSADGRFERLAELAADLVRRRVAVIAAASPPAALAAKRATQTIPIVFTSGADPVKIGLVSSFNRPGGNVTGFHVLFTGLVAKRLALLRELLPGAARVAVLVNPLSASDAEPTVRDVTVAGRALSFDTRVFNASTPAEIDAAFTALLSWQPNALFVGPSPGFSGPQGKQIATLAARHALPSSGFLKEWVDAGGLMSYGPDLADSYRQAGVYVGRILKGEKPADLPVVQPTKYELVINLKTAKVLGIAVPPTLLVRADEVIE